MKKPLSGQEQFFSFYESIYGKRWPALHHALLQERSHVAIKNPLVGGVIEGERADPFFPFVVSKEGRFDPPVISADGMMNYYLMDRASLYPAFALSPNSHEKVLDLCAAPGGKALYLYLLSKGECELVANDISTERQRRLKSVLHSFVPESKRAQIKITKHNAASWCLHEKSAYDKILLDAPCSSERHVLTSPKHLSEWSEGRTKRIAKDQWTMLAGAFLVLKKGGRLVYSTCSISPYENDGVVSKLFEKFESRVRLVEHDGKGESLKFGKMVLPDIDNEGPIYYSIIEKVEE